MLQLMAFRNVGLFKSTNVIKFSNDEWSGCLGVLVGMNGSGKTMANECIRRCLHSDMSHSDSTIPDPTTASYILCKYEFDPTLLRNLTDLAEDETIYNFSKNIYDSMKTTGKISDDRNAILEHFEMSGVSAIATKEEASNGIKKNKSDWKTIDRLGHGAMGLVYLWEHTTTKELLAAKRLTPWYDEEEDPLGIIEDEIKTMRSLDHENIVKYKGLSQKDNVLYILLEYMPGGSVSEWIQNKGAMAEDEASICTNHVLKGLVYLHDNNVIHRDIKGANILYSGTVWKLADFGIAKIMKTVAAPVTKVGTLAYMAPEIIQGRAQTKLVDVWSLGCTVVEMLCKEPPESGVHYIAEYELPKGTSEHCKQFLKLCFQVDPEKRSTAKELLDSKFVIKCTEH